MTWPDDLTIVYAVGILAEAVWLFALRNRLRRLQQRFETLREESVRMLGIHQNLLANHASLLRGLGGPAQPIPTMDQMMEAWEGGDHR